MSYGLFAVGFESGGSVVLVSIITMRQPFVARIKTAFTVTRKYGNLSLRVYVCCCDEISIVCLLNYCKSAGQNRFHYNIQNDKQMHIVNCQSSVHGHLDYNSILMTAGIFCFSTILRFISYIIGVAF